MHSSVSELSARYFESIGTPQEKILSYYFCDNQKDADDCAHLVLIGEKRATATSLWWFEINDEVLPKQQDVSIVTNWAGIAQCVIAVDKVELTPYSKISRQFAQTEGEGDKSLAYWRKVHWDYYHRELAGSSYQPTEEMLIVCEYFRVIFK